MQTPKNPENPDNPVIFVGKVFLNYISPISRFKKLNLKFENKTTNLSEDNKKYLSRAYLTFFLISTFFLLWFSYFDLKTTVEALSTYRHPDCGHIDGKCADTWLSGYVKQNTFKITTLIEVLFLVVGVVVGNIAWDQASEIKKTGFLNVHKFFDVMLIVALAAFVISLICNDLVDVIQDEYYYLNTLWDRSWPALILLVILVFSHVFYSRRNTGKP